MKKKLLVLLTALVAVTAGCKKDKDKNPDGNGGKVKYLNKVTQTEGDEISIFVLTYDNNNRVISYNLQDNSQTKVFTYDGGGNVTKIDSKIDNTRDVYEVAYVNGLPTTGTHKIYEGQDLQSNESLQYTVTNGRVSKIVSLNGDTETVYDLTYQNENLAKMVITVDDESFESTFTYGTKKSPLYPSLLKYIISPGESLEFSSKNDLLKTAISRGGAPLFEAVSTFTYDNDGYPITGTSKTAGNEDTILKFEYK